MIEHLQDYNLEPQETQNIKCKYCNSEENVGSDRVCEDCAYTRYIDKQLEE